MTEIRARYSSVPTRNPLRWALAAWRVSRDLTNTDEAAIVEIGFGRSRLGRRFARWEEVAEELAADPRTGPALAARERLGGIDLAELARLPEGSLGRVFGEHCRNRGIDPNLVQIPDGSPGDFVMAHLFETHDLWHVTTGWGNDELGEVGLGGFYLAQLGLPLIALMLALILLNTVFREPSTLRERIDALVAGYQMGKSSRPLFGLRWREEWSRPVAEIRAELQVSPESVIGEGVRAAA